VESTTSLKPFDQADPATDSARDSDALSVTERHTLMRDGLINNLSFLVSGIVGIALVPLMLKWLGAESYGIWIVAMTTIAVLGTIDLGLYPTVVREVSFSLKRSQSKHNFLFIEGAGNAYLLLGVAGAFLIGCLGYLYSHHLRLDHQLQGTARLVFWLVGAGFLVNQMNAFGNAILVGLRRFDYANLIKSASALLTAAGIIVLLAIGGSLISIAGWLVAVAGLGVLTTFTIVRNLEPRFHFRLARFHWDELRQRFSFALSSLLVTVLGGLAWRASTLLIGFMEGSVAVVPLYIGQKLPHAAADFGWRASEALYPAAAQNEDNRQRSFEILKVGVRWVFVLLLPMTVLFCLLGPSILTVWIGKSDPITLEILRLMSMAALADALMAALFNVLWGRGAMRHVVATMLGVGIGVTVLSTALIPPMGVLGAAWGTLLPTVLGACVLFYLACREFQANLLPMVISITHGLFLPLAGCALTAFLVSSFAKSALWALLGSSSAGAFVYLLLLYIAPGPNQERQFLQSAIRRVMPFA
jgi:O-antigen/teichoic acid export membrane protein